MHWMRTLLFGWKISIAADVIVCTRGVAFEKDATIISQPSSRLAVRLVHLVARLIFAFQDGGASLNVVCITCSLD